MKTTVRTLIVEDSKSDLKLLVFALEEAGLHLDWQCVASEVEYLAALDSNPEIILADYLLPGFSAPRALELLRERRLDIPFIIISGTIGEETAVSAIKQGATDYLLKDRLGRLGTAVRNALHEQNLRREKQQMQDALRAAQEFARNVLDSSLDMIIAVDRSRRIIEFNRAAQNTFGYSLHDVIGQSADRLYADPSEGLALHSTVLQSGQCIREVRNRRKTGETFSSLLAASALTNSRGEVFGVMGISRDITDRERNEARLAAFAALGRNLNGATNAQQAARIVVEAADRLIGWDACFLDLCSAISDQVEVVLAIDTVQGSRTETKINNDDRLSLSPIVRKTMNQGPQLILRECDHFSPDFSPFGNLERPSASLMFVPIRNDSATIGVLSIQSYTRNAYTGGDLQTLQALADHCAGALERIRTLHQLHETEQRFSELARHIREVFWLTNIPSNELVYLSPAYEEIWGRPRTELSEETFLQSIHSDDRDVVRQYLVRQRKERCQAEYRILRPDGSVRWIRDRAFPIQDDQQRIYRVAGVAEDITERKRLETQVFHAQRMESIGTLASGIAHDLNNVLGPILMAGQMLELKCSDDPESASLLGTIATSAQRGADIVKQVLTFARKIEGRRTAVQLKHLIKEMAKIARQTFPKTIEVSTTVSDNLWPVLGDVTQLHQVLLNLSVNARDAMPNGGKLTVTAENCEIDAGYAAMLTDCLPGPYVLLRIEDTGIGIPPEISDKIFDPFFTTKEQGKGTGLGLSTVLGIVKGHGGFVQVQSQAGKGAVFKVFLPATTADANPATRSPAANLPSGNGELILVADDELSIRELIRSVLTAHNFNVLVAADGTEAVVQFAQHFGQVKLLLTDIIMPAMDGLALVRAIRRMDPNLKIIASSGFGDDKMAELTSLRVTTFLDKPYTAENLLRTVAAELNRP